MAPNCSLIPSHLTVCVAGANYPTGRFYMIVRNGGAIIVQATPAYLNAAPLDRDGINAITEAYDHGLELIQTVLDELTFGQTNWAYLISQRDGTVRLIYHQRLIRGISGHTWAPLIEEKDIE